MKPRTLKKRVYQALRTTPGMEPLGVARKLGIPVDDAKLVLDALIVDRRIVYLKPSRKTARLVRWIRRERKKGRA